MNKQKCTLCLGSNFNKLTSLEAARQYLLPIFPDIRFDEEQLTPAIGNGFRSPFLNQVASFSTALTAEEVRLELKEIERKLGRLPEDKAKGIVRIDIDLLTYGEQILKPADLERDYIQKGLKNLTD